jgi:CRP-like cAMP-binding protein
MPIKQTLSTRPHKTAKEGKPLRNRLLLSIPESERLTIHAELEFIALPSHRCLHEPHQPIEHLYFPNEGVISLVITLKDGKTVEAGLVGNEGLTGMSAILGLERSPLREVVQIAGDAYRIRVARFKELLPAQPHLQSTVNRYAAGLAMQVAQTAACNRLHNIEHRLARWLLMAQDRVESELLPITHDFLATMLGTDRPSVSLAAGVLQKSQMINYRRGSLRVVNRKKLEKFACECYAIVQQYAGGTQEISGNSPPQPARA